MNTHPKPRNHPSGNPGRVVIASGDVLDTLLQHLTRDWPAEACGLLLGEKRRDSYFVKRAFPCANLREDRSGDRYKLDPLDFVEAEQKAEELEADIIGVYHSHPDTAPEPSRTDLERAWSGWVYLITEVTRKGAGPTRAWELNDSEDGFRELDIEFAPSGPILPESEERNND